jgi:hypothetical protein
MAYICMVLVNPISEQRFRQIEAVSMYGLCQPYGAYMYGFGQPYE